LQWRADLTRPADPDSRTRPIASEANFRQFQSLASASAAGRAPAGAEKDSRAVMLLSALPNCILSQDQPPQVASREKLKAPPVDTRGSRDSRGGPVVVPGQH
jgi:hypothetical protein